MKTTRLSERNFIHLFGTVDEVAVHTLYGHDRIRLGVHDSLYRVGSDGREVPVRMDTRYVVNLCVATSSTKERSRVRHDVVLFTSDVALVKKLASFQGRLERYYGSGDAGVRRPGLSVSMDGHAVAGDGKALRFVAHESSFGIGVGREEGEENNAVRFGGYVEAVDVRGHYAEVALCQYHERRDKDGNVTVREPIRTRVRVREAVQKELFAQLRDGTVGKDSFLVFDGRLRAGGFIDAAECAVVLARGVKREARRARGRNF